MFRTVQVNKPEFLELLMEGPFKGMDRSAVLAAVTDENHTSAVKGTYELKLDEADRAADSSDVRYSGDEVFKRARGRIHGRKAL